MRIIPREAVHVIADDFRTRVGRIQGKPNVLKADVVGMAYVKAPGRTSEQIAADLGISVSAVKQHITAVCEKLNASSRSEAVTIALRRHLLKI